MDARVESWKQWLQATQPQRYAHSLGVAQTAQDLAYQVGLDSQTAYIAGLLHDCAKGLPLPQLQTLAAEWPGIDLNHFPHLLHAPAGAVYARQLWQLPDEILQAIAHHAPAQPDMSLLDRVVYVADKIEPSRAYSGVNRLRTAVKSDFTRGFLLVIADEAAAIMRNHHPLHPAVVAAWNEYLAESANP